MQTNHDANLDFLFSMQILFTRMQMRNVHMMHMSPFRNAIFHDADVPYDGANATFTYDGASARIYL